MKHTPICLIFKLFIFTSVEYIKRKHVLSFKKMMFARVECTETFIFPAKLADCCGQLKFYDVEFASSLVSAGSMGVQVETST
jgi:hypothetical protein